MNYILDLYKAVFYEGWIEAKQFKKSYVGKVHRLFLIFFKELYRLVVSCYLYIFYKCVIPFRKNKGIIFRKDDQLIIISLTSYGNRIATVHFTIETLLSQSYKPDKIILWVNENEKALVDRNKYLNNAINRGLEITYCIDLKPYTKIIHALKEYPNDVIITADDDLFYPKNWLFGLVNEYKKNRNIIHCYRAHLMTYNNDNELNNYNNWFYCSPGINYTSNLLFPCGVGGVLYPPNLMSKHVLDIETFTKLSPNNDDIWLKAMQILNGIPCKKVLPYSKVNFIIPKSQRISLFKGNVNLNKNDEQLKNVFKEYSIYQCLKNSNNRYGL